MDGATDNEHRAELRTTRRELDAMRRELGVATEELERAREALDHSSDSVEPLIAELDQATAERDRCHAVLSALLRHRGVGVMVIRADLVVEELYGRCGALLAVDERAALGRELRSLPLPEVEAAALLAGVRAVLSDDGGPSGEDRRWSGDSVRLGFDGLGPAADGAERAAVIVEGPDAPASRAGPPRARPSALSPAG